MHRVTLRLRPRLLVPLLALGVVLSGGVAVWAIVTNLTLVSQLHEPLAEHVDQAELLALVQAGQDSEAFTEAFELGDEFFETEFNALDGGGANVGDGSRFSRIPRADLNGAGQWASHTPRRATGPNATACNSCHIQAFDDGSGSSVANVHRDPLHSADLGRIIQRNTPHLFAPGAVQVLAEEMTMDLERGRETARLRACAFGDSGNVPLNAKGVNFGAIRAIRTGSRPCEVRYVTSNVRGVDADLVVKPFQWKGLRTTVRDFNRDAAHNELGMQAVEIAGDGVDGDGDGVANEATVGDMTALAVYLAAQPRPTTKLELAALNIIDPLPAEEVAAIQRGGQVFSAIGCASCHVPAFRLDDPVFREPSRHPAYRDSTFPAGQNPVARGVDPRFPVSFDLRRDQPDNIIEDDSGNVTFRLGSLRTDSQGRALVELFGDLKRHYMGSGLAESIDEIGTGAATFLTENLWGLGSTGPYMHDGRATTLTEAILEHGGEAASTRTAFLRRSRSDQAALIAFLNNLILFKMEEDEVVIPPPPEVQMNQTLRMRTQRRR